MATFSGAVDIPFMLFLNVIYPMWGTCYGTVCGGYRGSLLA